MSARTLPLGIETLVLHPPGMPVLNECWLPLLTEYIVALYGSAAFFSAIGFILLTAFLATPRGRASLGTHMRKATSFIGAALPVFAALPVAIQAYVFTGTYGGSISYALFQAWLLALLGLAAYALATRRLARALVLILLASILLATAHYAYPANGVLCAGPLDWPLYVLPLITPAMLAAASMISVGRQEQTASTRADR